MWIQLFWRKHSSAEKITIFCDVFFSAQIPRSPDPCSSGLPSVVSSLGNEGWNSQQKERKRVASSSVLHFPVKAWRLRDGFIRPKQSLKFPLQQREGHEQLHHTTRLILKQSGQTVCYRCTLSLRRIASGKCTCRDVKADEAGDTPRASQDVKAVLEGLLGPQVCKIHLIDLRCQ